MRRHMSRDCHRIYIHRDSLPGIVEEIEINLGRRNAAMLQATVGTVVTSNHMPLYYSESNGSLVAL